MPPLPRSRCRLLWPLKRNLGASGGGTLSSGPEIEYGRRRHNKLPKGRLKHPLTARRSREGWCSISRRLHAAACVRVGGGWTSLGFRVGSYRTLNTHPLLPRPFLHIHILAPPPAARRHHIHPPLLARTHPRPLSAHIHIHSTTHPHCTLRSLGAGS